MNKKILFCASAASHIKNFHTQYVDYLVQQGCTVHIAANGISKVYNIEKFYQLPFSKKIYSPKNILAIFKLLKIIKTEKYDIISTHATLAGAVGRLALKLSGRKKHGTTMIHTAHGYLFNDTDSLKAKIFRSLEHYLGKFTDYLFVMNKYDCAMAQKYNFCNNIIPINGMGIDKNKFPVPTKEEIEHIKEKLNIQNKFVFLCVGEFSKRKNQAELIDAFTTVYKRNPNTVLLFAGDGADLAICKKSIETYNLTDAVRFLGQVENIGSIYYTADTLVSASKSEGIPFNIMEALLLKLPVIASNIKGHTDLITHNQNGILYELSDIDSLSDFMLKLSDDKNFYNYLKANSNLDEKFLSENVSSEILTVYKKVLGECI